MAIPVSASINQLNAEVFLQEGYELSLDAIVPSIELTGSFSPIVSKTQFYIYNYAKTLLYENLNYNANGSFLPPESGNSISISTSSYNQFELNPIEDIYNQGYSSGNYYALYNFIDYELGSEALNIEEDGSYEQHPYFLKDISGDRTELRIQNNFLSNSQIETYYQQFTDKINARENVDEFYVSFGNNRNFIAVNSQLEVPQTGSTNESTILIKLYQPLPLEFEVEQQLQIISKVGETQVFSVDFQPNLEFIDNLLQLKGPNYNIDLKDKVNNSTNYKDYNDLINTVSSQSYYQFNSLRNQKGVFLRKNWGDWSQFVKYSSAEQRLNNFRDKLISIESASVELSDLEDIGGTTPGTPDYSSSYNAASDRINQIISKFDSYEYFLYYVTGSESWPKFTSTYPYTNFSVTSSEALDWFGSTNENSAYYNSGKNQIYSASRYDNNNQDYLYYLIPPFITDNPSNNQYTKFVNMAGQAFDEAYLYTEAIEQVRNTNSSLTGSVLPLGLADDVIESLGFDTSGNNFNSIDFNPNTVGVLPSAGSGLEYITRYIDIASGSIINYYDQQQSTLGYVIALADPSFPYPLENSSQEIYKRIFHNMVSLVKRKGTVTGLRQLINIWGVPNTMLRISEFGGKNKDDENDYDLWMNRYSTAFSTWKQTEKLTDSTYASSSLLIPWKPLTSNYYDENEIAVPDCIQFRFKNDKPISTTSHFSSSLLIKPFFDNQNVSITDRQGAFGLILEYSGSNSGSFNGSSLPTDYQYGTLQLVISGSTDDGAMAVSAPPGTFAVDGAVFTSSKISLPFFDNGWWSVQLQRKVHLSASFEDNTLNEYELRVANNIYDGYDGNQIGFQASASITMIDGKVSESMNESWNNFYEWNLNNTQQRDSLLLPGIPSNTVNVDELLGIRYIGGKFMGVNLVGQLQEFRYYRRALSGSQFNDYVMNPESIQGHADANTGKGSSYDLLSFRAPLGNELEFTNTSVGGNYSYQATNLYGTAPNRSDFYFGLPVSGNTSSLGSLHPSIVNQSTTLFTSSFLIFPNIGASRNYQTSSIYQWQISDSTGSNNFITASYMASNIEINYMDQPSAGIRNRIKNKIQVIDGNEYGTILSPFRSIQQEFEQSSSYTEDLNSLEVGFSFQNEINDDIISTFGHGVVSDAIADPRFISESNDRYPELTRIANDYFKKYQGYSIRNFKLNTGTPTLVEQEFDYNRLIKFYETSLFRAIKNYVPARTSLSTGIIVKQHLLERNKTHAITGININTPIAKTPETGSDVYGYTDQTGFNSIISQRNLLITASIPMETLTGSAGGSINKYNITTNEGQFFKNEGDNLILNDGVLTALYPDLPPASSAQNIKIFTAVDHENKVYVQSEVAFRSQFRFNGLFVDPSATPPNLPTPIDIKFEATSSKRGGVFETTFSNITLLDPPGLVSDNYMEIYPDERIYWNIMAIGDNVELGAYIINFGENSEFNKPEPSASQQVNWYIDDFTGEYKVDDHQTEFYNGEYSGSNFEVIPAQYNPYRIFVDGNNQTPDTTDLSSSVAIDITQAEVNTDFRNRTATSFDVTGSSLSGFPTQNITGSVVPSTNNFPLEVGATYDITFKADEVVNGGRVGVAVYVDGSSNIDLTFSNVAPSAPTTGIDGVFSGSFLYEGEAYDIYGLGITPTYAGIIPIFTNMSSGERARLSELSVIKRESIGFKHFNPNDGFTIIPSQSQLFQNSPYNPIINNVSSSRPNSKFLDMDFDPVSPGSTLKEGIPNDYSLTVSASQLGWEGTATANALLEFAEVPESNYTTLASANPRYDGCLLESADYNFYTGIPSESLAIGRSAEQGITGLANPPFLLKLNKVQYINGETGSWNGDISYGKNAVIDRNPINLAHFKTSYQNPSNFGTTTFVIDQLIQVPFEEILSEQSPIITSSLINGSNENLVPMSSTFMPLRKAAISYNNSSKTFAQFDNTTIKYSSLAIGSKLIKFSAIDFENYYSNQIDENTNSQTLKITRPLYLSGDDNPTFNLSSTADSLSGVLYDPSSDDTYYAPFTQKIRSNNRLPVGGQTNYPTVNSPFSTKRFAVASPMGMVSASITNLFTTGSSNYTTRLGFGILNLRGPVTDKFMDTQNAFKMSAGSNDDIPMNIIGPSLSVMNSLNIVTENGTDMTDGIPGYKGNMYSTLAFAGSKLQPTLSGATTGSFFGSIAIAPTEDGLKMPYQSPLAGIFTFPLVTDTDDFSNYFRANVTSVSGSNLPEYEPIIDNRIIIRPGDEIRVSYQYPHDAGSPPVGSGFNQEIKTQDFTVIDYELAPPTTVMEPNTIPLFGDFVFTCSVLSTSSEERYRGNPYQIDEYYKRMKIIMENSSSMFVMNKENFVYEKNIATDNYIGSGSSEGFIKSVEYGEYVVNNDGENNPTVVYIEIEGNNFTPPDNRVPGGALEKSWLLGTNNNGINPSVLYQNSGSGNMDYVKNIANIDFSNGPYIQSIAPGSPSDGGFKIWTPFDPGFVYDRLIVSPDPSTLTFPIPSGSILGATIRRRINDDTKVTLDLNMPSGSRGIQTPSGDGYIIPDDFTPIQQRNVQKIINKLQSENVFQQNTPNDVR